jgi:hypothetical protein
MTNKLTEDLFKVIEAAEAGNIIAHRIIMLAIRFPQDAPSIWDCLVDAHGFCERTLRSVIFDQTALAHV